MALSNEAAMAWNLIFCIWNGPTLGPFLKAWNRKKYNLSTVDSSSHTNVFTQIRDIL